MARFSRYAFLYQQVLTQRRVSMIETIDTIWLTIATFLVLLMQAGFLLLEGGRVRSKNSINVAQKNASDLAVSWVCFMSFGFLLMFGAYAPMTEVRQAIDQSPSPMEFLYQLAFCATAASIISGAVAERITFRAYLALTVVVSGLIYPIVGRMVWGDMFNYEVTAWLHERGFRDFAGSTVVHGTGAWVGLTALLILGPRTGRFDENGKPTSMQGHSSVLSLAGILLLLFCWLGFNGGSISPSNPLLQRVLLNTLTAAAFGSLAGMFLGAWIDKGVFNPTRICNGIIGGLVACTAAVNVMSTVEAIAIGTLGGLIATYSGELLLVKCKLDDPLDVVATHGIAGAFGTLSVAFVGPISALPTGSRLSQFGVQLGGVILVFTCVSLAAWLALTLIGKVTRLRVSVQDEKIGLNYTEHGESIGSERLQKALNSHIAGQVGFGAPLDVASNDENSELAASMNALLTKHEEAKKQIRLSEKRFQHFAQTSSNWLWETNSDLEFTFFSANSKENDYNELADVITKPFLDVLTIETQDEKPVRRNVAERKATGTFEARLQFTDQPGAALVEVRGVPYYSQRGNFSGYRGTISDITPRKAAENRAVFLSMHDDLTGLLNRRALNDRLPGILAAADQSGLTAVIAGVDLDGFKAVNDNYGHNAGDSLLTEVAERLEAVRRPDDLVFRTGGDEFVVVLTGFDPEHAKQQAETICNRIINEVSKPFMIDTHTTQISASIGIALHPEHSSVGDNLARLADLALYAAKAQGKSRVITFDPSMDAEAQRKFTLEKDLRIAIDEKQFYLMYQPLIETKTEQLLGFEALIRWTHPEHGEIPPGDFIFVAEQLHLMDEIGEYVLREACSFATHWTSKTGQAPTIAVNVSPDQLRGTGFTALVKTVLDETGLAPSRLELEITEDVLVSDFDLMKDKLLALRDLGVAIAVDDFGSGQTSLRYLNHLPVSKLKIDRSFIRHLSGDPKAADITRSIVDLGRKLGVSVLAEGVEENNQLQILKNWDCDQVQGYLFSKPVYADAVDGLIQLDQAEPKKAVGE